jgi:hypothetical protein
LHGVARHPVSVSCGIVDARRGCYPASGASVNRRTSKGKMTFDRPVRKRYPDPEIVDAQVSAFWPGVLRAA